MSFDAIDWQRPWLAPFKEKGQQLIQSGDWLETANQIASQQDLRTATAHRVVFVPQQSLAANVSYEAHIHASGEVPTRHNLHDFFNTLAWLHFPKIKKTLNALHAASQRQVADSGDTLSTLGTRGHARDAATLFDENAALFVCSDQKLAEALREHRWAYLLQRSPEAFFQNTDVVLFGHALIEKLVRPYKAITAHVWITMVDPDWFKSGEARRIVDLDCRIAAAISDGFLSDDFAHLPVLGVPGWWSVQDEDFYKDSSVFRAPRTKPVAP